MIGEKELAGAITDPKKALDQASDAIDHLEENNGGIWWPILFWMVSIILGLFYLKILEPKPWMPMVGFFVALGGAYLTYCTLKFPRKVKKDRNLFRTRFQQLAQVYEKMLCEEKGRASLYESKIQEDIRNIRNTHHEQMAKVTNDDNERLVKERQMRIDLILESHAQYNRLVSAWNAYGEKIRIPIIVAANDGELPEELAAVICEIDEMAAAVQMPGAISSRKK